MINIMIADDQEIVREGLKMILSLNNDINIIAEASNGKQLLDLLKQARPEVILMDIRMPIMDGIKTTSEVKKLYPDIKIIVLTTFQEDEYIFDSLKNGADSYVLKDSGSDAIVQAVKAVNSGKMLLDYPISRKVIDSIAIPSKPSNHSVNLDDILTPREIDVIKQLVLGKSNRDIGKVLFLSEGTVKNYISRILSKLELNSRAELLVYLQNV